MASTLIADPEYTEQEVKYEYSRMWQASTPTDDRTTREAVPPERLRLAEANIRYLSAIIKQLVELRQEEEKDDYGTLQACQHAFDVACHLLTDAAIVLARKKVGIPRGCASTDSEGGIRIEWVRPNSSVHLVVPATQDRKGYIYHEAGDEYNTVSATPEKLVHLLGKLSTDSPSEG